MRVPNRSLWAAPRHGAGFAPGASQWTPCRGRDLTGPGSIPVHPPGREDRGGSGRTGLPGPIPIVLLPGFEYRMSEWQHPQAHETHWRLERGTAAIFGDDDEKHPLKSAPSLGLANQPPVSSGPSRQVGSPIGPAGPMVTSTRVQWQRPTVRRRCVVCQRQAVRATHGARRQGVRGPEPGLDRCWSPEPAPCGHEGRSRGAPPPAAGPPRRAGRRGPPARPGGGIDGPSSTQRWWF